MVNLILIAVSYLMYLGIVASVLMPALHHLFCRRHPQIRFDDFPSSVRFAKNVTHFLIEILGSPRNFGHNVYENMASVYHAMESFDILSAGGREVHFQHASWTNFRPPGWKPSRSGPFYMLPHTAAFIDEYPSGTCFRSMVVGHTAVASLHSVDFSRHRAAHIARFRRFYLQQLQLHHFVAGSHPKRKIVVNVYPKVVRGLDYIWSDVCKLSKLLEETFFNVEFRCIALHSMSIELQAILCNPTPRVLPNQTPNQTSLLYHNVIISSQVQLISAATVHVWPNGTCPCSNSPFCLPPVRAFLVQSRSVQ